MNESIRPIQSEEESSVMAILKNPQPNTSVTKFAGPYINSIIIRQQGEEQEG